MFISMYGNIHADNNDLCVTLLNGSTTTFSLKKKPSVKFTDNKVIITTDNFETEFTRNNVKNFTFIPAKSENISEILDNVTYQFSNNIIKAPGEEINVYNISGIHMLSGQDEVSLENLANGIYFIKLSKQTFKVIKK